MSDPFRYFNSSPEVIRLVVMMYVKYPLSLRNVEDLLAERGIDISHETVRFWWNRFGPIFAAEIRKRRVAHMRGYPQWRWHLDEAFVKVNGKLCYLWRAVDHEGEVLEAVVTAKRDKAAALKFLKRIMKKYGRPLSVVTDGLCSYPAAMKEIGNADRQEAGRRLNNRAENSHQPFRRRERAMQRFRSMKTLAKIQLSSCPGPQPFQSGAPSRHPPGLQTKALRRVGRVERPRGLIAAWVCAWCAQRRRPAVALTKPTACRMIAGGNWWRANEIVIRHPIHQTDARQRSRDKTPQRPRASLRREHPRRCQLPGPENDPHRPSIRLRSTAPAAPSGARGEAKRRSLRSTRRCARSPISRRRSPWAPMSWPRAASRKPPCASTFAPSSSIRPSRWPGPTPVRSCSVSAASPRRCRPLKRRPRSLPPRRTHGAAAPGPCASSAGSKTRSSRPSARSSCGGRDQSRQCADEARSDGGGA